MDDSGFGTPKGNFKDQGLKAGNLGQRIPAPPMKSKQEIEAAAEIRRSQDQERRRTINMKVKEMDNQRQGVQAAMNAENLDQGGGIEAMYKRNTVVAEILRVMKETGFLQQEEEGEISMSGIEPMEEDRREGSK